MKFTYNWLKEFVATSLAPADLAGALTMAGLEVESLTKLGDLEGQGDDWLFEVAVTPNRGDWLSIAGIAREVAALTQASLKTPEVDQPANKPGERRRAGLAIAIENAALCPRYSARMIGGLTVGPSPEWLKRRLEACGFRSVSNVVDATNYVMLETGQPLHAFDLEKLRHQQIIVKPAGEQRTFTTLDGVARQILADDLLIWDGPEPVALAGVMGGLDSQVQNSTVSVLIESANFASLAIRRTAKRLGLHSEASHRFERHVDPEGTVAALNRAAYLLRQIASAKAVETWFDAYPGKSKPPTIVVREERIERLLGTKFERGAVLNLLDRLGVKVRGKGRLLTVTPPSSRSDITREADVIEELARLRGYDQIPSTVPHVRSAAPRIDPQLLWERRLRSMLAGAGLTEVINLPFTGQAINASIPGVIDDLPGVVPVQNPLAKDDAEMRRSLVPGLIGNLRFNLDHKSRSFHGFHLGKVFGMSGEQAGESQCIAALLHGPREAYGLAAAKERVADFFDCKGLVESVLELFHLRDVSWERAEMEWLHPGQSARVVYDNTPLGYLGQIHPDTAQRLELPAFFLFELDFTKLLQYAPRRIKARTLPRFPSIERDVALVVDRDFACEKVIRWIKELDEPLIEQVTIFDQYVGSPIADGKKSLAYKISYRAPGRTLTDAEVNDLHQRLIERLGEAFGVERRS